MGEEAGFCVGSWYMRWELSLVGEIIGFQMWVW